MINVERKNSFQLRLSRQLKEETSHTLDVYFFVPGELGLSTQLISEEAFYHAAINVSRTYYSNEYHLPLMHSRLASRNRLGSDSYRLSLSLYAYQYVEAMERTTCDMLALAISMLTRLMSKSKHHIYRLKDGQAVRESVERRHLFNLVVRETGSEDTPYLARWKVVVSRSGIVDVEKIKERSVAKDGS